MRTPVSDGEIYITDSQSNGPFLQVLALYLSQDAFYRTPFAARPAFNLDLSNVVFASSADATGKAAATVGNGLQKTEAATGTVKFTMKDATNQQLTVDSVTKSGGTLVASYSNATTAENNQYISCVLTDNTGGVQYYGKLKQVDGADKASGTLSIPLDGVEDGSYTLQIFSEEANDDKYTDFCSDPVKMSISVSNKIGTVENFSGKIHEHSWNTATWNSDETGHWHECTATDCPVEANAQKGDYAMHNYDQQVADQEHLASAGDCENPDKYYKSCVCGRNGTETFSGEAVQGHDWGDVSYKWNGTESCSAERVCKNNDQHIEKSDATITSEVTTAATCTEAGVKTYTAAFSDTWAETQTQSEAIPALGHSYGTEWKFDKDGHWHECSVCGDKADEAKHTLKAATGEKGSADNMVCEICGYEIAKDKVASAKPSSPSATDGGETASPKTGDDSNMALWIALMLAALAGVCGTFLYGRKEKNLS